MSVGEKQENRCDSLQVSCCATLFRCDFVFLVITAIWYLCHLYLVHPSAMPNKRSVKSCQHKFGGEIGATWTGQPYYIPVAVLFAASNYLATCSLSPALIIYRLHSQLRTQLLQFIQSQCIFSSQMWLPRKMILCSLGIIQSVDRNATEYNKGQNQPLRFS